MSKISITALSAIAAMACPVTALAAPLAGLAPYERPAAPVIREFAPGEASRARALHGISRPYPESILKLLDQQGGWHTPLDQPGMAGRYDLRGWHAPAVARAPR